MSQSAVAAFDWFAVRCIGCWAVGTFIVPSPSSGGLIEGRCRHFGGGCPWQRGEAHDHASGAMFWVCVWRPVCYQPASVAGEMAERLKAHAWKACVRESVPRVRIPVSPPATDYPFIPTAECSPETKSVSVPGCFSVPVDHQQGAIDRQHLAPPTHCILERKIVRTGCRVDDLSSNSSPDTARNIPACRSVRPSCKLPTASARSADRHDNAIVADMGFFRGAWASAGIVRLDRSADFKP